MVRRLVRYAPAMMLRLLPLMLALAACAKQGQVPARTMPEPPAPDLYNLCRDARFQSMCTPVPDGDYQQVDTNLQWRRALVLLAG